MRRGTTLLLSVAALTGCLSDPAERGAGAVDEPKHVASLSPRAADDCIGQARVCTFAAAQHATDASQVLDEAGLRAAFGTCLAQASTYDDAEDGDVFCEPACAGDAATELCDKVISTIASYAGQPAACVRELDRCMRYCATEGDNWNDGIFPDDDVLGWPEAMCLWAGSERANCDMYASSREPCGGSVGDDEHDHAGCMALCDAAVSPWGEDSDEDLCTDESSAVCEYCQGQCEGVGDGAEEPTDPPVGDEPVWESLLHQAGTVAQGATVAIPVAVPAGVAHMRVTVTPATGTDDPDLVVKAPGQQDGSVCDSAEHAGLTDECTADPMRDHDALTAGTWTVEVAGYETGEAPDVFSFTLDVAVVRVAASAGN